MILKCINCGKVFGADYRPVCDACEGLVDVEYAIESCQLHKSSNPFDRFLDLLPIADRSLLPVEAEYTPCVHAESLGRSVGLSHLYLKNETVHPTGSTKDRMAAVALAFLHEHGVRHFCTSSTGNSSTAFIHGIERVPGMHLSLFTAEAFVDRVSSLELEQVQRFVVTDASFVDAFKCAGQYAQQHGLTAERGFFNPGRREGLKLAFMEATDQVPTTIDWYVQAVSSAMGVYGTHGGAQQLVALGHIARPPRLLCVQQDTCAPMVSAWRDDSDAIQPHHVVEHPTGIAMAILRGDPTRAYPHVHRITRQSGGSFEAVTEKEIREARRRVEQLEGIRPCFSASTALAGLIKKAKAGEVQADEVVLVNLTGRDRALETTEALAVRLVRTEDGWEPEPDSDPADFQLWREPAAAARRGTRV